MLGRNGGWILVVFGIVLVPVVVVIRKERAAASILAFSGVAAVIFGVLLSRLQGAFEFGPTKVRGNTPSGPCPSMWWTSSAGRRRQRSQLGRHLR